MGPNGGSVAMDSVPIVRNAAQRRYNCVQKDATKTISPNMKNSAITRWKPASRQRLAITTVGANATSLIRSFSVSVHVKVNVFERKPLFINAMLLDLDAWGLLPFLSLGTTLHSLIPKMYKKFQENIKQ
jgi:hypothetical protein